MTKHVRIDRTAEDFPGGRVDDILDLACSERFVKGEFCKGKIVGTRGNENVPSLTISDKGGR